MFSTHHTRLLYFAGLAGIVAGLSLSKPAVSIGVMVCAGNWLLEKDLWQRIKSLKSNTFFWISLALVILHVLGLLWSDNIPYGLKDIKTKLPIVLLPLFFLSSKEFNLKDEMRFVKIVFIGSLVICTLLSFGIYFHWIKPQQFTPTDMRTMIFGVSGVRLALFICLAIAFLAFDIFYQSSWKIKTGLLTLIVWFLFFLNFIESGTAVIFLTILMVYSILYIIMIRLNRLKRNMVMLVGLIVVLVIGMLFYNYISSMLVQKPNPVHSTITKYGEVYKNYSKVPYLENGYVVGHNIAINELTHAWNKRSAIKIGQKDKNGQAILITLLRYLNSKSGIKDRDAVEHLTAKDISDIENGVANYTYQFMSGWQKRLYQIVYEFETYNTGLNPYGNSVTQRFEYWKIGYTIARANILTGVGTGDVQDAYNAEYDKAFFKMAPEFRLRAHNQYLTMLLTFGIIGLLLFLIYAFSILWTGAYKEYTYFALAFVLIMLFSFLSEDTLETQSGVTFISFFLTLFIAKKTGK